MKRLEQLKNRPISETFGIPIIPIFVLETKVERRPDEQSSAGTSSPALEREDRNQQVPETDGNVKKEGARLPTNYTVARYKYKQTPNFDDLTFIGEETIDMEVTEPSKELTLNGLGLDIHSAQFTTGDGQVRPATIAYDKEEQRVTFGFDNELEGNGALDLSFTGDFKDDKGNVKPEMNGTYLTKWQDKDGQIHYWATTQHEATDARKTLVVADEPDRKAVFEVTLVTPKGWGAISNTKEERVYEENGLDVHVFEPTPQMSSYLLANVVGEFDVLEAIDSNGHAHRVVATPGKGEHGEMALDASVQIIPFFEEWTEIPYPLSKHDNIAVPDFEAGAMENWGAVTYREERLLVDPQNSSQATKEDVLHVIAHEDAHMWFGDLVSPKWWTYLWLNESFAEYMAYVASDHVHPEWKVWDKFIVTEQNPALGIDALQSTHPIEVAVNHPREIGQIFDLISYQKGSSVLDMLSHYIGEENFRLGTSNYLKEHANGNATTQDLLTSYEETSGLPVREMMENWLYKPGHPVIVVKDKGDHVELTQERFFLNQRSKAIAHDDTVWQIPLAIREEGQDGQPLLMKDTTMRIDKKGNGNWFLINERGHSFVRVDYPESMLETFREPIANQSISPSDRNAIVRDVFDLAQSGSSSVDKALAFVDAYKDETNFAVWSVISEKLANVANILDSENHEVQEQFNAYARSLLKPIADRIGWDKKPGESNKDTLLRELVIANLGKYGDPETIRIAKEKFESHTSGQTLLDPDLRSAVYKIVATHGGEREYEQLMDIYKSTNLKEEKGRIISILGAFKDPSLIDRSLHFALYGEGNEEANRPNAFRLMASAFTNPDARDMAWEFTKENWEKILEVYGDTQTSLPKFVSPAMQFHSLEHAKDVEEFFASHKHPGSERMVQQTIETITSKADWMTRDREKILHFLETSEPVATK